jgi:hypothetical protein
MPEIVAIRSFGAVSLLEHHANLITPYLRRYGPDSSFREEDQDAKLVPKDELPNLIAEIEQRLAPAKPSDVAKAVAMLFASFKIGDVVQDPKVFGQLMREELAEFPADVLQEAVRQARRTLKWLPSIAEMIDICSNLRAHISLQLGVAQLMTEEYQRREKKVAERAERMRQNEAAIAEFRAREAENLAAAEAELRARGFSPTEIDDQLLTFRMWPDDRRALSEFQRLIWAWKARNENAEHGGNQ